MIRLSVVGGRSTDAAADMGADVGRVARTHSVSATSDLLRRTALLGVSVVGAVNIGLCSAADYSRPSVSASRRRRTATATLSETEAAVYFCVRTPRRTSSPLICGWRNNENKVTIIP